MAVETNSRTATFGYIPHLGIISPEVDILIRLVRRNLRPTLGCCVPNVEQSPLSPHHRYRQSLFVAVVVILFTRKNALISSHPY